MPASTNPLLTTINSLPIFKIPCQRKYTTIRKANAFRVKFYGVDKVPDQRELITTLAKEGWTKIVVLTSDNWNGVMSLTVVATK